jgi:hypothetical protein
VYGVYDTTGQFLGPVIMPEGFTVVQYSATHVWGVRYGIFGEPYVVRNRTEALN